MHSRQLGPSGPEVSVIGLGCMGMSDLYGGPQDRAECIATIQKAIDAGVTLIDTGDFYGMGHNELLIGEALEGRARDQLTVSVKFGMQRDPAGNWLQADGRPNAVKSSLAYTLKRLNTDYIDIYRLARLDPDVPIEDTIGAMAEMVQAGYVRHIGLSEVGVNTIRRAAAVHAISDLQIEYSLFARGIEPNILPALRELGIGLTAYGVLSRGLLSGKWKKARLDPSDFRATIPWFYDENIDQNLALVNRLGAFAERKGATVAQLAIAWIAAQGTDVVPLVGPTTTGQLNDCLGATDLTLDADDLAEIAGIIPPEAVAGARSSGEQLEIMDSEH